MFVCLMAMVSVSCEGYLNEFICFEDGCERAAAKGSIFCSYHSKVNSKNKQCAAYTKSKKRCKRTAEKGSIYCWQHKYNH